VIQARQERQGQIDGLSGSVAASINSGTRKIVLTLVDLLHEFDPNEHPAGIVELLEAEHRLHPSLDAPVVLLHDVVQELTGADLDCIRPPKVEFIPHAHPPQCGMGRLKAVERDGSGLAVPL